MVSKKLYALLALVFVNAAAVVLADAPGLNVGQPSRILLPTTSGAVLPSSDNPAFSGDVTLHNAAGAQPSLKLGGDPDFSGTEYIQLQAPGGSFTGYPLTLPEDDGDAGEFLKTNGSGVTSWDPVGVSGLTGLGTGVATFLATPSSANFAAAITDETGTGLVVLATSPTLVTPALGTPSAAVLTNATGLPLTSGVTGVLPIANGGTNKALTLAAGGVFYSDADSFEILGAGTSGQVLTSGGAGAPTWSSPLANPMDSAGDLIVGGAAGAATKLDSGASGQILMANGAAAPSWLSYKDAQSNTYLGPTAGAALTASATNNTFIGSGAGAANTNGDFNTAIGDSAGALLDGSATAGNTLIGASAGAAIVSDGISNTAVGRAAGSLITTGDQNTMLGRNAGDTVTTGGNNVIAGYNADASAASTASAVVIGDAAVGPSGSVALGVNAHAGTGTDGIVIGNDAGQSLVTGIDNIFIGHSAGNAYTSGTRAVVIGVDANANATPGSTSSVSVGDTARATGATSIAIGKSPTASGTDSIAIGNAATVSDFRTIAIGAGAKTLQSGVSIGYQAGAAITHSAAVEGWYNTLIGESIGTGITTGYGNALVGSNINGPTIGGIGNAFLGYNIGNNATSAGAVGITGATGNVIVGSSNDLKTATTTYATVIGSTAVGGNYDVAIGFGVTSNGSENVFIGDQVGYASIPTATGTVAIGQLAAQTLSSGIDNTLLGHSADVSTGTFTNSIALGNGATVEASNAALIGNASVTDISLGDTASAAASSARTIRSGDANGTNQNAGAFTIAGSRGTGTGTPGTILMKVAPSTTTGTTLHTLATAMTFQGGTTTVGSRVAIDATALEIGADATGVPGLFPRTIATATTTCTTSCGTEPSSLNSASGVCLAAWRTDTSANITCADSTNVAKSCLCAGIK